MNVAEQVLQLKTDFDEVKQSGYIKGEGVGRTLGYNYGWNDGLQQGKKAEYDRFWDVFQENGERSDYSNAFQGRGWTDEIYEPKYPIIGAIGGAFRTLTLTDTKVPIIATGYAANAFLNCNLSTIRSLDMTAVTNTEQMFTGANKLQNITIAGKICLSVEFRKSTLLSKASIESIVEHLSDTASGLTLDLSKTAVTNAFGSTTADEWTALIATKPNWTITLA